jgi:hypothetical protein
MSDDDIINAAVKKTGDDIERVTRRNMKLCVTEHIQTLSLDDPKFARNMLYPNKSLKNCFRYINQKAVEYLKEEMEMNDEKPGNDGFSGDVPDGLCYKWAEEYYNDLDAEIDKDKDDKFVPKQFYGGGSSSKSKKKETAKTPAKSASPKSETDDQVQLFGDEGAA